MFTLRSTRPLALFSIVLAGLAGCGGSAPSEAGVRRVVTADSLEQLPRLSVEEGRFLCEGDGRRACAFESAFADWLDDGKFLTWEPGRDVQLWAGDSLPMRNLGGTLDPKARRVNALAAGSGRGGDVLIVDALDNGSLRLLRYDNQGRLRDSTPLPHLTGFVMRGLIRSTPVMTRIASGGPTVTYSVHQLGAMTDTSGRVIFSQSLPWMPQGDGELKAPPFFAPWPSFTIDTKGGAVWTTGAHFDLHRTDAKGHLLWELAGDLTGPPITPEQLSAQRRTVESTLPPGAISAAQLDSMVSPLLTNHPAVTGVAIAQDGRVLISGPTIPGVDSVLFTRVSKDGRPEARFTLPTGTRVLLFAGDSILIHHETLNNFREMRWLQLHMAARDSAAH